MTRFSKRLAATTALACGLAGLVGAGTAQADTTLTYVGASGTYDVAITPEAIRIDGEGREWQLYRADDPAILSVEPGQSRYTRLDRTSAARIRSQMDQMRARMERRLSQLPDGKRTAARVAMADEIPGMGGTGQVGLEATGARDTVNGVPCKIYQVIRNGEAADTMCVASAGALGLSGTSYKTVQSMFALLQEMLEGTGLEGIGLPYQNLDGMPIRFIDGVSGEQRTLSRISHETLPDRRFEIPRTYVEEQPQRLTAG